MRARYINLSIDNVKYCLLAIETNIETYGNTGVSIDLTNFTNINVTLGTISPRDDCKQVACELNGTWTPGNTQEFTVNKTITVTAN